MIGGDFVESAEKGQVEGSGGNDITLQMWLRLATRK